jgi:2-keto-4-pentenoate hydratase/2-oxohepta-3-ene-1,7-dioic acid hydratase in catechol pathway
MQSLTFKSGGALKLGLVTDTGVIDAQAANAALGPDAPTDTTALINGGGSAAAGLVAKAAGQSGAWLLDRAGLTLGPCVDSPGKIICIGLNYAKHAAESNMPVPESPVVFSKFNNTLAGDGQAIKLNTKYAEKFDWEVELCVAIGKTASDVSEDSALDYVYGYCTANDLSVRDLQNRTSQWLLGKTPDNFFPIGPSLVSADEVGDPQKLQLSTKVNGEIRQNENTNDMIFNVRQLISYLSRYFTLEPGDLITTGTPSGVAMGLPNTPWLKVGDVVEVEVEKLGVLTNRMV